MGIHAKPHKPGTGSKETLNIDTRLRQRDAVFPILIVAAILCLTACDASRSSHQPDVPEVGSRLEDVTVEYVKDGDSFVARHKGKSIEVRLFGIDAPEKGQPYAKESRKAARTLLNDETIVLVIRDQDRYKRLVAEAYVTRSTDSVNQLLVEQGAAWVYTRYTSDPGLLAAQESALKQRRGLWSLKESDRIEPWTWRKNSKK